MKMTPSKCDYYTNNQIMGFYEEELKEALAHRANPIDRGSVAIAVGTSAMSILKPDNYENIQYKEHKETHYHFDVSTHGLIVSFAIGTMFGTWIWYLAKIFAGM